MFSDILDIFFRVAGGVFIEVTVFAGLALVLFGYLNFKSDGSVIKAIQGNKKFQPFIGALLGLIPGCGGAILIIPLYVKKTVSFGAVVAALIATMGDASFLLMTKNPSVFILLNIITVLVAVFVGYFVDYLRIEEKFSLNLKAFKGRRRRRLGRRCKSNICQFRHIGHDLDDEVALVLHDKVKGHQSVDTISFQLTHKGYFLYFFVLLIGLIIGLCNMFSFDFFSVNFSKVVSVVGIAGTFLSVFFMFAGRKLFSVHTHEEEEMKLSSLKETFVHSAVDIAFIGTWVFVAFFLYELMIYFIGNADYLAGESIVKQLAASSGYYAILIGALVGMIPGCGPQIIFVSLYLKGILPFEALVAHSISQDGDALLPLIAMDIKSSLVLTVITTIVAIIVGFALIFF